MIVQQIPLAQLERSTRNVRKTGGARIDDLAASILAHGGLLQNLIVMPSAEGRYGVIAGGRRLAALQHLVTQGHIDSEFPVPCQILEHEPVDGEISLAENFVREAMHPADQFDAFKRLVDAGLSAGDVAARFGVTELMVQQRLKLAKVAPELVAIYRADGMSLEQLMAFTVTNDVPAQVRYWKKAQDWQKKPDQIRAALTKDEIDAAKDARARFVGLAAFEQAGGEVRRDLFGGPDAGYLRNVPLLEQLAATKLEEAAARVRAEGWAWVEVRTAYEDYRGEFGREYPERRQLVKADAAELKRLQKELDDLQNSDDDFDAGQFDALEAKIGALVSTQETWSEDVRKHAGVIVSIDDRTGALAVHRGLLKQGQRARTEATGKPKKQAKAKGKGGKGAISEALQRRLVAQRTAALRAELLALPAIALAAIVHRLALDELYGSSSTSDSIVVLSVSESTDLRRIDETIGDSLAEQHLASQEKAWEAKLPSKAPALWSWLLEQPQATVLNLLAFLVAKRVDALHQAWRVTSPGAGKLFKVVDDLDRAVALDMRKWWKPTVATYLGAVPKARVLEALTEAGLAGDAKRLADGKSAAVAAEAEALLAKTPAVWLPELLRSSGTPKPARESDAAVVAKVAKQLKPKKSAAAKKAAAKPAKKKPAKGRR